MGDFFNDEQDQGQGSSVEVTPELEAQYRDELREELFEGKVPKRKLEPEEPERDSATEPDNSDEDETDTDSDDQGEQDADTDDTDDSTGEDDDSVGVPDELKKISKSLNMLTVNVQGMESRLKQAEKRIGGINTKLHEAKSVPKTDQKSPTDAQIDRAAKSDSGWDDLQKNFPDWAKAFENRIAQSREDLVSKDDMEQLRQDLQSIPKETGSIERRLVGIIHPDFKEVVQSPEYRDWLESQDVETINKAYNDTTAEAAIDVLNKYKAHRDSRSVKSEDDDTGKSNNRRSKKQDRLEASTVPRKKTNSRKAKAEDEMTEDEYRAKLASELF